MVKRKISPQIMEQINNFIEQIKKHYDIDAIYLFGSQAKGLANENSDIDLAVVSKDVKDHHNDMVKMMIISSKCAIDVEPHPFNTIDFNDDDMMADEILRTGIRVA